MCLIAFAWQSHPRYRLILAANRDERHDRPADPMHWWEDAPEFLAGRDRVAGGTWLGIARTGRFATVTNYRESRTPAVNVTSRGNIVTDFALGRQAPADYTNSIDGDAYAGVNVLVCDGQSLGYVSNRGDGPHILTPGFYGLSNAALDSPWTKLVSTRTRLQTLADGDPVSRQSLIDLLADRTVAAEPEMDADGISRDLARAITAPFIVSPDYGTRSTTVFTWSYEGEIRIVERRFDAAGESTGESSFEFRVNQA